MTRKIIISVLVIGLAALEIRSVFGFHEDWPITSNSMFAYYRTPETPLYDFVIALHDRTGHTRRLQPADLGIPGREGFRRLVFSRWYGSTDANFPQGHDVDQHADALAARLTDLCHRVFRAWRAPEHLAAITMEIDRLDVTVDSSTLVRRYPLGECANAPDAPFVLSTGS